MKLIDIHTHIYPEQIARKATQSVKDFYQVGGADMDGTARMLLSRGTEAGISQFVVLPVAIRPDRVRGINDFILSQVAAQPRFIGFGTVHAGMEGLTDEAQHIIDTGLHGVKIHPDSQRFAIDDIRMYPVYEMMQDRLPIMMHMGDHRYNYSHPVKLRKILDQFPRLKVIAAHFGGYTMYAEACDILKDTQCVLDVSSSLMYLPDGEAEKYIGIYGPERMAFGTDYPMWDPVTEVERFLRLKLPEAQLEQIAWKTAATLLKL